MSTLFLVATPIGNLEDISARALRTLSEASLIAAEDTRHTGKLLEHFGIQTRLTSYHEHNKQVRTAGVLAELEKGDVALVSDAGTPALNDPGYELVQAAIAAGHTVSPIPGACAPVAALVASGLPSDAFLYLGYLARKPGDRKRQLAQVSDLPYTLIFLETPHRLLAALVDLQAALGDRQAAVGRELTKLHEEIFRGNLSAVQAYFTAHEPRGEFTLVVAGKKTDQERWSQEKMLAFLQSALERGEPAASLARQAAETSGWKRREIYALIVQLQQAQP